MKQKSYSIATPSFNNSNKLYQIKAIPTNISKKVYSLQLTVVSPFIETEKDYPIKVSPFSRYKAILDEEVPEVASRIRTVDSVLSKYYIGNGVKEKGAIIQESQSSHRYIEHLIDIVKDLPSFLNYDNDTYIIEQSLFIEKLVENESLLHELETLKMKDIEYAIDVLEDESALKVLRVLMGSQYIENLKSHKRRIDYAANLAEGLSASLKDIIYRISIEESLEADYTNRLAYMPELISATRQDTHSLELEDYELFDFLFLPFESRMFDIEFHERRKDAHHFAVTFNDYDTAIKPTVHESNMRHEFFELAERTKLIRDVRFYDTEVGVRNKSKYGIHDVTILPDTDEFMRVHLELDVNQLEYEFALKPTVIDSIFHDHYTYAEHNMTRESHYDQGYEEVSHNMTRDSIYDSGYEIVNHNMTRYSSDDDGFDIFFRLKEVDGVFSEYDEFYSPENQVYMNEFDLFMRRNDKVALNPVEMDTVSRRDESIANLYEQFSYGSRVDEWNVYREQISESYRADEFLSLLEVSTNIERSDVKESVLQEYTNVVRADEWLSLLNEVDKFNRVNEHNSDELFRYELTNRVVESHDTIFNDSVEFSFDSSGKNILIEEFLAVERLKVDYESILQSSDSFKLKDVIWDGGQYHEFIEGGNDYVPSYMIDYDLFERRDVKESTQLFIDESYRVIPINDLINHEFDFFTRIPVLATSPISFDESSRVDVFETLIQITQESLRDKTFNSLVQIVDSLKMQERVWTTDIEEQTVVTKVDEYVSIIEELLATSKVDEYNSLIDTFLDVDKRTDYISDIIEDVTNYEPVYKSIEIIEYFDFIRDMEYDTSIIDVSPADAIKVIPEPPVYETRIIDLDSASRISEFLGTVTEFVEGKDGMLDAYLPEFDLFTRFNEFQTQIEYDLSVSRVDIAVADIILTEFYNRDNVFAMEEHYEQWADSNRLYDMVEHYEQWSDKVQMVYETKMNHIEESTKYIDYVASLVGSEEFTKIQDYISYIETATDAIHDTEYITQVLAQELVDRNITYEVVEHEYDLFGRIILEGRLEENIDWFERTIVDVKLEDNITWYTRTEVDVKLIETDQFVRDLIYDASLEEFDGFDGQDLKDYTWLWHSRPYWWLKWNWAKTK